MSKYNQDKAWSDFRVGVVTFAGLFLLILGVVFAGGDKGLLFRKTSIVKARLGDVGGLKKGCSVTMGGMTIGRVTDIAFAKTEKGVEIEVMMQIRSDIRGRIKADSIPAVRTQGMLGDRYIDISMGSEAALALPEGASLLGDAASDFDKTLRHANDVLSETEKLLSAVNEQRGTVGRFVYDEQLYKGLTQITDELNELLKDFKKNPRRYIKFSLF